METTLIYVSQFRDDVDKDIHFNTVTLGSIIFLTRHHRFPPEQNCARSASLRKTKNMFFDQV